MNAYDVFKDFAGPVATIVAATAAAVITYTFAKRQTKIAHLQAKIALDKLKYDTYEDRLEILNATRKLIRLVVNVRPGEMPDVAAMQECRRTIENGKFLFNDKINAYLTELVDECFETPDYVPEARGRVLEVEEREALIRRGQSRKKVVSEMSRVPRVLEKDLSLNFLKETTSIEDDSESADIFELFRKTDKSLAICGAVVGLIFFLLLFGAWLTPR